MKSYLHHLLTCFIALGIATTTHAQTNKTPTPTLNQPAPNFSLNVLEGGHSPSYPKTLNDYRGKWLVLEFWTRTCSVCIQGMPKLDSLKQHFAAQANFLLIGKNDERYNKGIEVLYQGLAKNAKLSLDVAFDTTTFKSYGVKFTPHVAIIDPKGTLVSLSAASELDKTSLAQLFAGKNEIAQLYPSKPVHQSAQPIHPFKKALIDSTSAFPHRSTLSNWTPGQPMSSVTDLSKKIKGNTFTVQTISLSKLYQLAYLGKTVWDITDSLYLTTWSKPLIETAAPQEFESDLNKATGTYTYAITLQKPNSSVNDFQLAMQADLANWFGYRVSFQQRNLPIYELKVIDTNQIVQLKSKQEEMEKKGDYCGYKLKGVTAQQLIAFIHRYHRKIIFDGTHLPFPIDLDLKANMTDFTQLKHALKTNGLELVEIDKQLNCLVIMEK